MKQRAGAFSLADEEGRRYQSGMDDVTILDGALELARRGLLVVPLYGMREDGECECPRPHCDSAGKHPRIKNWQHEATSDPTKVEDWWKRWPGSNVGVASGPSSKLIDVECDSEEAEAALVELFGGPENFPDCPTFSSGRGKHRLFAWSAELATLPESGKAVFKFRGIEFRIGGGGKGGQSVYPPSRHKSGARYAWLPGLSLDDVELRPLPDAVMATLLREGSRGERTRRTERPLRSADRSDQSAANGQAAPLPENVEAAGGDDRSPRHRLYEPGYVLETVGERDTTLHAEACALWREQGLLVKNAFDDPATQALVFERLMALNLHKCRPPLEEATVLVKVESARKFIRDELARRPGQGLSSLGLEYRDGEWWPGRWKATCIRSIPLTVRLEAPCLPAPLVLSHEAFHEAFEVALAVLSATGNVCLDRHPGFWSGIWNGVRGTKGTPPAVGLKVRLLEAATFEDAPREEIRPATVAEYLWRKIDGAYEIDEDRLPTQRGGSPMKLRDGRVLFKFEAVWEEASRSEDKIKRSEMSSLLKELGCSDAFFGPETGRIRFKCLSKEAVKKLKEKTGLEGRETGLEGRASARA
jgi:hypothetical protein